MRAKKAISVLLVDDQSIMLDGLEALMEGMPDFVVVGRATNGQMAVQLSKSLRPDVIVMDISMPGMDGIEASKLILKEGPESRILVLSMYNHKAFLLELLDAGASGYVLKNTGKEELLQALTTVARGERYISEELRTILESRNETRKGSGEEGYKALSKREIEVMKLIVQGHTTQEVSEKLFLSRQTVDTHRKNIMHKLDLRNAVGMAKYATERGWTT